ncbi:MAG: type II secretion system protein [Deinococcota bacterium]
MIQRSTARLQQEDNAQAGFGIIEAIVSTALFAVLMVTIMPAFLSLVNINHKNELRSGASYAAQHVLDELRQTDFPDWPQSGVIGNVDTGTRVYDYELTYCTSGNNEFCATNMRQARVEIFVDNEVIYDLQVVYTDLGNGNDNLTN